jgi:WD40 repeat protein
VWELETERELYRLPSTGADGTALKHFHPTLSSDGNYFLTKPMDDGVVRIWNLQTGKEVTAIDFQARWIQFSPSKVRLAVSSNDEIRLFQLKS